MKCQETLGPLALQNQSEMRLGQFANAPSACKSLSVLFFSITLSNVILSNFLLYLCQLLPVKI